MHAVQIDEVSKRFSNVLAVDRLSLNVPEDSIYGFIGPNGSGKTTTLRIILRILLPDEGNLSVFGDESKQTANDHIGYLPEERGLYKKMRVVDLLRFFAELKSRRDGFSEAMRWLELLGLSDWAKHKVESLSKGMAQKIQFIGAVIGKPRLLILDEPFAGLDPVNAEAIKQAILDLRKHGTTVIFSTHDMEVAERMCDFICMIFRGKKVIDGTLESIQDGYGQDVVRVRMEGHGGTDLSNMSGVEQVTDFGKLQELRLREGVDSQELLHQLTGRGTVRHFELARPSLRDIFVRIAGPDAKEASHE